MENDYEKLFEVSFEMLAILDLDGNFKDINRAFTQALGWTLRDLTGKLFWELVLPNEEAPNPAFTPNLLKGHPAIFIDNRIICKNGSARLLRWTAYPNLENQSIYLILQEPISEESEWEIFKLAIEASPTVILIISAGEIRYANRLAETVFGYWTSELVGQPVEMLVPTHLRSVHRKHQENYNRHPYRRLLGSGLELSGQHKDGRVFPIDIGLNPLQTPDGPVVICSIFDMTKRREAEAVIASKIRQLEQDISVLDNLAKTDALTSVKNRRSLDRQLEIQLRIAQKNSESLSFVLLDVDNFKSYNDSYGHLAGDQVLQFIAEIMVRSVRHTEVVARYGGEEFGVILPLTNALEAKHTAERLRKKIEDFECPFQQITVSIGCATVSPPPNQSIGADEIANFIRMADIALYFSKNSGKNRVTHFEDIPGRPEENLSNWKIRHETPTDH